MTRASSFRLRAAAPAALLAAFLAACAARDRHAASPPPAPLHELKSVAELAERFDRDRDHPRVVLLLSPT